MSNPELKLLAFDEDYDFNLPPPPEEDVTDGSAFSAFLTG